MTKHISEGEILQLINRSFPDSYVEAQASRMDDTVRPIELLARYLVAVVDDLYSKDCEGAANLERIATSLEVGSQALQQVVRSLQRRKEALKNTP